MPNSDPATPDTVFASLCPLCGQPNGCAMEQRSGLEDAPVPCWCTTLTFTEELLQRIPEVARRKACVCLRCATQEPVAAER
jgi:hypothetical protein